MSYSVTRGSPRAPTFDIGQPAHGNGSSTSIQSGEMMMDEGTEDDGETVESLQNKLSIERAVQFGAEKMLDVIEQRTGGDSVEQERMTNNIIAQLEAANERIRVLENRLDRLHGGGNSSTSTLGTPNRNRRGKAQVIPKLHGYGSNASLTAPSGLSSSVASSSYLSNNGTGNSGRPIPSRSVSSSFRTPDRDRDREREVESLHHSGYLTPSPGGPALSQRGFRSRSSSFGGGGGGGGGVGTGSGTLPMTTMDDQGEYQSGMNTRSPLSRNHSNWSQYQSDYVPASLSTSPENPMDQEKYGALISGISNSLHRLRELARAMQHGKGKGREVERGGVDEVWEILIRLADTLKKNSGVKRMINPEEVVISLMAHLSDGSNTSRRAAAYRCLRYFLDRLIWKKSLQNGIEWLIIRTFTRDSKSKEERESCLRLLRSVINLPPLSFYRKQRAQSTSGRSRSGHSRYPSASIDNESFSNIMDSRVPLTDGLIRAIVSAAENPDDPLQTVCVQSLVEIGALDLPRLVQSAALRTILAAFKDGPYELGPPMTGLLLYLTNRPATRELLIPGSDLETALVGLTENYSTPPAKQRGRFVEILSHSVRNVSMLLSSWQGLLYLCMDDYRAIKSLITSLHAPAIEMRDALLDLFFASLRIKTPTWLNAFIQGKRLTVYNRTQEANAQHLNEPLEDEDDSNNLNLVDHYISFLLAILIEAGLIEALVFMIENNESYLSRKATLLLGEILQLSNRTLPLPFAAKLQSLPKFFDGATEFSHSSERQLALTALSSIDSLNRNQSRVHRQVVARERVGSVGQDPLQSFENTRLRMAMAIEDRQFQQMIVDSGVLLGRDHTKWNYDIITALIEGPLFNTKRMDEAIKATKFIRRLMSFYHPLSNRFSAIKRTRPNHKWVKLGCALLGTILMCPEGIKFLSEDRFLKELAECFTDIEQHPNSTVAVFSSDRLQKSLSYGYFEMIGVLTKHREGLKLMEKFKFFNSFYHLSDNRKREDILRFLVECFDYAIDAHPRIIFSKALTCANIETRLFATHHLGRLLHEQTALRDLCLTLMVTQLYDPSAEVAEVAVMYVEEACTDPDNLQKVAAMKPTVEHLSDIGHPLFMRFVSTSVGFTYLFYDGYIDRELESWITERNLLYVIEAETFLSKTLRPFLSVKEYWQYDTMAPTHFLGELTKTPEGCMYLKGRGLIPDYCEFVRLHGMEENDEGLLMTLKTVLWALGNIGSTEGGLPFLEDEEIVEVIVEIAEQSPVLTIRGTCFFVIGLLSTSRQGAELLEELGWISTRNAMGKTTGLCLPNDIKRFVFIEKWSRPVQSNPIPSLPRLSGLEGEIITWIANLSNYVLAAGAMNNLKRTRIRHPRYFSSITLFHRALRMISTNHYQAPVRKFILDLFDIPFEMETLTQLCHIEAAINAPPNSHGPAMSPPRGAAPLWGRGSDIYETRRRSVSYPGQQPLIDSIGQLPGSGMGVPHPPPMPPRTMTMDGHQKNRIRGLTLSEMRAGG